jgi:hypothetical protein
MTMPRTSLRPLAALAFVAAALAYAGCSSKTDPAKVVAIPSPASTDKTDAAKDAPSDSNSKQIANWPTPNAALVISGEQDGYLEPCGCTAGQLGGLLRRYDLTERLTAQKWPFGLVDLGGLIKDPAGARGGFEEAKLKFGIAEKALATMKYDAVALSANDLKVGIVESLAQSLNNLGEHTKLVSANVSASGFENILKPSVRTTIGSVKIGITAVTSPESLNMLKDPDRDVLQIKPMSDSLAEVLADLEKDTTVQVLLVQGSPEEAKMMAETFPGFEVVVGTSHFADPSLEPTRLNGGKTMLVNVGQKGKYVGVVGFFDDPKEPIRYQRVTLGNRYNGPATAMKKVVEDELRSMLKATQVVENFPRRDFIEGAKGAEYVGADMCKRCHPNSYAKWSTTKHAQSFTSLEHDPKPNVIYDAECISCHTTGFEYNSGWKSPTETAYLKSNQCENCHGPSSKHVEFPDDKAILKTIHRSADDADHNRTCLQCHDEDNSPKFEFKNYWGQVAHSKMDSYDDPKVHKGIDWKKVVKKAGN